MDPDAISTVVTAIALGAAAGAKSTAETVVTDAYAALKAMLGRRSVDVSALERRPSSAAQRAALEEILTDLEGTAEALDEQVLAAAEAVATAVAAHQPEVADVVGVDLRDVETTFLRVREVSSAGSGVVGERIRASGGIEISGVRAGVPSTGSGAGDPLAR